jgi:phytoene dehydrogenase-like protein
MPISLGESFSFDQTLPAWTAGGLGAPVTERRVRVLVVGAGLAGLTCAFRLAEARTARKETVDMLVLEREKHVGGRIRSLAAGSATVNLGAVTFQPGHYPHYMKLLADLGLAQRVRPVRRRDMLLGINGRATRADNASLAWDGLKGLAGQGVFTPIEMAQLLRFYVFLKRVTGPNGEAEFMALHEVSVSEWARRFGFSPELSRKFVETFSAFCFQSPDQLSAAFGVFLLGFNLSRPATLAGGLGQVAEAMASRLAGHLETGATVVEVQREPEGFTVLYRKAGSDGRLSLHRARSRWLVLAVPAAMAARLMPELGPRAGQVAYGAGSAGLITGQLRQPFGLHLQRIDEHGTVTIVGGEACADGDRHLLNVLAYRGRFERKQARTFMANDDFEVLGEYDLCPAVAAPRPGQTPLPMEWADGLYLAGDCTGMFPSQETAVSSGEHIARRLEYA